MADPTYVNVTESDFRAKLESVMGFEQARIQGVRELVFERPVVVQGQNIGYKVRVYSSVAYGETRDVGEDAIRIQLIDESTDRPVKVHGEKRDHKAGKYIKRTAPNGISEDKRVDALLERVRKRCREFYGFAQKNICPKCDTIMAHRTGKFGEFKSCTSRECKHTENMS
jgi:hypothetical protein